MESVVRSFVRTVSPGELLPGGDVAVAGLSGAIVAARDADDLLAMAILDSALSCVLRSLQPRRGDRNLLTSSA